MPRGDGLGGAAGQAGHALQAHPQGAPTDPIRADAFRDRVEGIWPGAKRLSTLPRVCSIGGVLVFTLAGGGLWDLADKKSFIFLFDRVLHPLKQLPGPPCNTSNNFYRVPKRLSPKRSKG